MSSKKRTENKRRMRDIRMVKRGSAVQTRRSPKNQKAWDKKVGYATRLLSRAKYFKGKGYE